MIKVAETIAKPIGLDPPAREDRESIDQMLLNRVPLSIAVAPIFVIKLSLVAAAYLNCERGGASQLSSPNYIAALKTKVIESGPMRWGMIIVWFALMCVCHTVRADDVEAISLWEAHDPGLQSQLDRTIAALGLKDAVRRQELAVAVVDITHIDEPRVAEVNGDLMVYAASLPKIGILLAACADIESGRLRLSE
jgi:hypothetical protein